MNPVGIMQGRLSPVGERAQAFPGATWRDEFAQARDLGFDRIEWLVTAGGLGDNPFLHDHDQVNALVQDSGVLVETVCADCFIERPLVRVDDAAVQASIALLDRLVTQSASLGAHTIVVPLLEGNAVADARECAALLHRLADVIERAHLIGVRIAVESDLPARELRGAIEPAGVGVCYDIGNAAAAGEDLHTAITMLGDRVFSVHVKDRLKGGGSVALGSGAADFRSAFASLRGIGYAGPLILETPRGHSPLDAARAQLAFVRRLGASSVVVA